MSKKTGWVEKHQNGRVSSMVQVFYRKIKVKKTPKKSKFNPNSAAKLNEDLYYVLDKKINFGHLELTGESLFSKGEVLEVEFQVAHFNTPLRLLAKILKTESFLELKRVLFRGELKFAAVNKEDYDRILVLETERVRNLPSTPNQSSQPKGSLKLTFKQG